jgi:predicted LPLAT superfamily acyltransferase
VTQHWSDIHEAGALRGMRIMVWVQQHLGRTVFNFVLVPLMAYFYLRRGEARRSSLNYLRRVRRQHPESLPRGSLLALSFRHFLGFGHSLLEKYLAWTGDLPTVLMKPQEQDLLFNVVRSKQGCLAIASHLGNLEYSRGISRRHPELVMNVLLHDKHASKFANLMAQAEPVSRMHLLQVTEIDLPLALLLKEKVDRGEWIVIAGDRVPLGDSPRVSKARFLSDAADFPIGPMVLASVLRCPVYLLHCFQQGGQHHLGFELFAEQVRVTGSDKQAALQAYLQQYATALEVQLLKAPLQWFNFFDFWGDQDKLTNVQSDH